MEACLAIPKKCRRPRGCKVRTGRPRSLPPHPDQELGAEQFPSPLQSACLPGYSLATGSICTGRANVTTGLSMGRLAIPFSVDPRPTACLWDRGRTDASGTRASFLSSARHFPRSYVFFTFNVEVRRTVLLLDGSPVDPRERVHALLEGRRVTILHVEQDGLAIRQGGRRRACSKHSWNNRTQVVIKEGTAQDHCHFLCAKNPTRQRKRKKQDSLCN